VEELQGCEVRITPSWLVYLWGKEAHRLSCLRWADLVLIEEEATVRQDVNGFWRPGKAVVLTDRHDFRIEIVGTELGIRRLLTNVAAHAPWALHRHDRAETQSWETDRKQIIAEVDLRRKGLESHAAPGGPKRPEEGIQPVPEPPRGSS
jgi:hypothetical protein